MKEIVRVKETGEIPGHHPSSCYGGVTRDDLYRKQRIEPLMI